MRHQIIWDHHLQHTWSFAPIPAQYLEDGVAPYNMLDRSLNQDWTWPRPSCTAAPRKQIDPIHHGIFKKYQQKSAKKKTQKTGMLPGPQKNLKEGNIGPKPRSFENMFPWQFFFVTFLGWLSDIKWPFQGLSGLQPRAKKVTLYHLVSFWGGLLVSSIFSTQKLFSFFCTPALWDSRIQFVFKIYI